MSEWKESNSSEMVPELFLFQSCYVSLALSNISVSTVKLLQVETKIIGPEIP